MNIKQLIIPIALCSASSAWAFSYTVSGKFPEGDNHAGQYVYLQPVDNNNKLDSALVAADGSFTIKSTADNSYLSRITCAKQINGGTRFNTVSLFAPEEADIVIDAVSRRPLSGGNVNTALSALITKVTELGASMRDKNEEERKATIAEVKSLLKNSIAANPGNGVGEYAINIYGSVCSPQEWIDAAAMLSSELQQKQSIASVTTRMKGQLKAAVGKKFIDVTGKNAEGKPVKLSDYVGKGKYVLVDFWASWCGPCMHEANTVLKPLYERYKNNDRFEIVGIVVNDAPENAKGAMTRSGFEWPQIIGTEDPVMADYGFNSIPMLILFGPDGTIMDRGLRGQALTNRIDELLK